MLYVGLALTPRGPRVIEFNARFGDPETQVVLARLLTPLGGVLLAAATGRLRRRADAALVRGGGRHGRRRRRQLPRHPAHRRPDHRARRPARVAPDVYVLHAGTARDDDGLLVSAGGRVLSVVATGATLAEARERVYTAVDAIELPGSHHRTDIALRAERGEVTV